MLPPDSPRRKIGFHPPSFLTAALFAPAPSNAGPVCRSHV
jgi:hypothetical protein